MIDVPKNLQASSSVPKGTACKLPSVNNALPFFLGDLSRFSQTFSSPRKLLRPNPGNAPCPASHISLYPGFYPLEDQVLLPGVLLPRPTSRIKEPLAKTHEECSQASSSARISLAGLLVRRRSLFFFRYWYLQVFGFQCQKPYDVTDITYENMKPITRSTT